MNNKSNINYIKLLLKTKWKKRSKIEIKTTTTVQKTSLKNCQFQTSETLLFMGVQKLYGSETSQFLPCLLQVLDKLWQLFIFSNHLANIGHFTVDLLKRSDT